MFELSLMGFKIYKNVKFGEGYSHIPYEIHYIATKFRPQNKQKSQILAVIFSSGQPIIGSRICANEIQPITA